MSSTPTINFWGARNSPHCFKEGVNTKFLNSSSPSYLPRLIHFTLPCGSARRCWLPTFLGGLSWKAQVALTWSADLRTLPRSRPSAPLSPVRIPHPTSLQMGGLSGSASWTGTTLPASPPRGSYPQGCSLVFKQPSFIFHPEFVTFSDRSHPAKPTGASHQRDLCPLPPCSRELPASSMRAVRCRAGCPAPCAFPAAVTCPLPVSPGVDPRLCRPSPLPRRASSASHFPESAFS